MDFGTTYSGYSFQFRHEFNSADPTVIHVPQCWNNGSTQVSSMKTPTCLLLDNNKQIISFGFEVIYFFKKLDLEDLLQEMITVVFVDRVYKYKLRLYRWTFIIESSRVYTKSSLSQVHVVSSTCYLFTQTTWWINSYVATYSLYCNRVAIHSYWNPLIEKSVLLYVYTNQMQFTCTYLCFIRHI